MTQLARRFGATPQSPVAPGVSPVRSLLAIAIANAVEGCVRETYGAVVGLIRRELAWAIKAWVDPLLTSAERDDVTEAMRDAIAARGRDGDARVVDALDAQVWIAKTAA